MAKTIYLISVGKATNKNISMIIEEYFKRISPFFEINSKEIKEFGLSCEAEKIKEGKKIIESIPGDSYIIVCDEKGKSFNSESFFNLIDRSLSSKKSISLIIGGAFGLSDEVKDKADLILSLSSMTLTHQIAKIVIVEQLYRYCMFKENHPFIK